jgi:hypothetical protein
MVLESRSNHVARQPEGNIGQVLWCWNMDSAPGTVCQNFLQRLRSTFLNGKIKICGNVCLKTSKAALSRTNRCIKEAQMMKCLFLSFGSNGRTVNSWTI